MKGWLSVFVFSLFSVPFVVGQSQISDVSESGESLRLDRAIELTTDGVRALTLNGDADRAYNLFKEAISIDPEYAPAQYSIAQLLMQTEPRKAVEYSRQAYLSDTTNHWYLTRYAQSIISTGDYSKARLLYEKLLELRPLDLNAYRILAILYQQESKVDKAISLLDTAELRVGRNPYLMTLKRQMLISTNQIERAIREAKAMVDESPYTVEPRVSLAELYASLRRDSLALREYEVAMQIDSTRVDMLLSMGDFMKSSGRDREYLYILRRIVQNDDLKAVNKIQLVKEVMSDQPLYKRERMLVNSIITALAIKHPNNKGVVELRAQHLISLGMVAEASGMVKGHLNDEPAQLDYYRMVIDMERYQGRLDSVSLYMDRAIDRFPEVVDFRLEKAYMLVEKGEYDESIELFKGNLEGATDSLKSSIWGTIGDIEHQKIIASFASDSISVLTLSKGEMKRMKKALRSVYESYDLSLSIFYDNAMVLNNYAYFLSEYGGDLKKALEMSKRSNELVDGNPTFIDTYAWILYRLERYEEAKVEMRRAVSFDRTNNYEIALHYGEILWVLGESTMAEFYWGKALQWGALEGVVDDSKRRAESNKQKLKVE